MTEDEYTELVTWWESVCPTNLERELCARFLRPSYRPRSVAEKFEKFADDLARLWYASESKAGMAPGSPDWYGKWSDDRWIYNWSDEFFGPLPKHVQAAVSGHIQALKPQLDERIPMEERWNWERYAAQYQQYPVAMTEKIIGFLDSKDIEVVHYNGYLDDGLVKAIRAANRYKLTGMDMSGRYEVGHGYHFDDELSLVYCGRPPWLEGVALYSEGGPTAPDACIRDTSWTRPDTFNTILTWHLTPRRPPYFVLITGAIQHGMHHFYEWTGDGELQLGVLKREHVLDLTEEEWAFRKQDDARMRGERNTDER